MNWNGRGRWIEPFIGTAVVLLNVGADRALVGDTNRHLIDIYKPIQHGIVSEEFVRRFLSVDGNRLLREGEDHYYRVRERFNRASDPHDFLFLNRSCFKG